MKGLTKEVEKGLMTKKKKKKKDYRVKMWFLRLDWIFENARCVNPYDRKANILLKI
jgi:hypothetical protein